MRKHVVAPISQQAPAWDEGWLNLDNLASVEVTSEDADCPIQLALLAREKRGWRAAKPGSQTIRLIFDDPQRLRRIWLAFEDIEGSRTQAFLLRWSPNAGEDYAVDLYDVTVLELIIVPDKSGGEARASLVKMRLAG
jgi:hypothetical protein